jgi:hypothetical protein
LVVEDLLVQIVLSPIGIAVVAEVVVESDILKIIL